MHIPSGDGYHETHYFQGVSDGADADLFPVHPLRLRDGSSKSRPHTLGKQTIVGCRAATRERGQVLATIIT